MSGGVLYVYAVTDSFTGSAATGLHGAPLRAIECGPVQAVVSEHAAAPDPGEDLLWAHERVVEELMEGATILPMRFGTIVEGPEALVAMLEPRREELDTALERVRGAVELSVRAELPSVAEPVDVEPLPAGPPGPGTAYLLERAGRQRRGEEAAELIHRPLAALARRSMRKAGGGDPRAFKAAYLVDEGTVAAFGVRVDRLNATLGDVRVSCTGPWPPYSFVSEEPG
jgi:Gas vesicle synthesis protein GvpL/GvpF